MWKTWKVSFAFFSCAWKCRSVYSIPDDEKFLSRKFSFILMVSVWFQYRRAIKCTNSFFVSHRRKTNHIPQSRYKVLLLSFFLENMNMFINEIFNFKPFILQFTHSTSLCCFHLLADVSLQLLKYIRQYLWHASRAIFFDGFHRVPIFRALFIQGLNILPMLTFLLRTAQAIDICKSRSEWDSLY